jgi:stage V sporulation protein B
MKPESFLRGAMVLTIAGVVVKLLGAVYRIPFTRIAGSEGIGLYQMAYPIYVALLSLSTAGIPVALSFLIAERGAMGDRHGARQVFSVSLIFLFCLGCILAAGLFYISPFLAQRVLGDTRAPTVEKLRRCPKIPLQEASCSPGGTAPSSNCITSV